ncbi:MAG: M61 family peptidase [Phenylobacterium sp.]|nr:MAG: M61 family peptidase [Phenylobacterium sp.]
MRLVQSILAVAALACLGAAKPAPAPLAYTVSPEIRDGALVALDVSLALHAGPDGRVQLELPDASAGVTELWRNIKDLKVEGASGVATPSPAERLIQAAPGAPLTVRYRVVSAFDHDPSVSELETYQPLIRPTRFWVYGEALFALPKDSKGPASFRWVGAPAGFGFASDLEHAGGKPMAIADLQESVLVGGPDLTVVERRLDGAPLRVAALGRFGFTTAAFVDLAAKTIAGERAFWGGKEGPFLVALTPLGPVSGSISVRGEGRGDAFAIQGGADTPLDFIKGLLAHEYFHTWNPRRLGGMHDGDVAERADYWFSEGFTDFYARRLALRSETFSLQAFVEAWNQVLKEYAASPNRTAPNAKVVADFWKDSDVQKLPYRRGAILAATWDRELRARSGGRVGLDDVMRAMRDRAAKLGAKSPKAPQLFEETARDFGLEVGPDVERIVETGAAIALPQDAFGGCITVATRPAPVFERGYEIKTRADGSHALTKVAPDGPAYAAGLRDGMTVRRISGWTGNVEKPWEVWVLDETVERRVSYLPIGKGTMTQQQLELPKELTPTAYDACARAVAAAR